MPAIYNENDAFAADWLVQLETQGHIAPGVVERRSIVELTADDVAGPGQRHFFAGIGGWSYALRLAGVPDDVPIWTGSCPCQPFSTAGKRSGTRDPRHLWPTWFALIEQCRPPVVFGEQVASKDGLAWLDAVFADLERCGYTVGAADLCAAGVGAPHARQRLYFVAHAGHAGREVVRQIRLHDHRQSGDDAPRRSSTRAVVDAARARRKGRGEGVRRKARDRSQLGGGVDGVGDAGLDGTSQVAGVVLPHEGEHGLGRSVGGDPPRDAGETRKRGHVADTGVQRREGETGSPGSPGAIAARSRQPWDHCEWIPCRTPDGAGIEWRPIEPGTQPLVDGFPGRVGRLRGYGNAVVTEAAATFIEAGLDAIEATTE